MPLPKQHFVCSIVDLKDSEVLPNGWSDEILTAAEGIAQRVFLHGHAEDSREPQNTAGTDYYVVPGDLIRTKLPWLYNLYEQDLCEVVSSLVGRRMKLSRSVRLGVNINVVKGHNARYEWHVDSSPVSAVLFATTHGDGHGGELAIRMPDALIKISPQAGSLVVFNGRLAHSVLPLVQGGARVSVPMIFFYDDFEEADTTELEEYLYPPPSQV